MNLTWFFLYLFFRMLILVVVTKYFLIWIKKWRENNITKRFKYFLPVIFSLIIVYVGVFGLAGQILDCVSIASKQSNTTIAVFNKYNFIKTKIYTTEGSFQVGINDDEFKVGKKYSIKYLPWSRFVISTHEE